MKKWAIEHKQLLVILSAAFILRLVFLLFSNPWPAGSFERLVIEDGREYYDLAVSMLNNHSFNGNLLRTPGQPLIILALLSSGMHFTILFVLQIILNVASILLIYSLIKELLLPYFDPRQTETLAIISCLFYAIDLQLIYFSASSYYADINFSFFVYAALLCFVKGVTKDKLLYFALSGLCAGISTLIKPAGEFMPIVFPVFFLYAGGALKKFIPMLKSYLVFLLVFIVVLSPWIYRNYTRFNAFVFSSSGNVNIRVYAENLDFYYRNGQKDTLGGVLAKEGYFNAADNYQKSLIEKKVGMAYIKANFNDFLKFYATNVARIYLNMSSTHICNALNIKNIIKTDYGITQFNSPGYAVKWFFKNKTTGEIIFGMYILLFICFVYTGALIGLTDLVINKRFKIATVALVFISYFTLLPCPAGQSRYKFPAMPFYLMFFAVGVYSILKNKSGKSTDTKETGPSKSA